MIKSANVPGIAKITDKMFCTGNAHLRCKTGFWVGGIVKAYHTKYTPFGVFCVCCEFFCSAYSTLEARHRKPDVRRITPSDL